eukprot:768815-Hanusia_phi.AAC.10
MQGGNRTRGKWDEEEGEGERGREGGREEEEEVEEDERRKEKGGGEMETRRWKGREGRGGRSKGMQEEAIPKNARARVPVRKSDILSILLPLRCFVFLVLLLPPSCFSSSLSRLLASLGSGSGSGDEKSFAAGGENAAAAAAAFSLSLCSSSSDEISLLSTWTLLSSSLPSDSISCCWPFAVELSTASCYSDSVTHLLILMPRSLSPPDPPPPLPPPLSLCSPVLVAQFRLSSPSSTSSSSSSLFLPPSPSLLLPLPLNFLIHLGSARELWCKRPPFTLLHVSAPPSSLLPPPSPLPACVLSHSHRKSTLSPLHYHSPSSSIFHPRPLHLSFFLPPLPLTFFFLFSTICAKWSTPSLFGPARKAASTSDFASSSSCEAGVKKVSTRDKGEGGGGKTKREEQTEGVDGAEDEEREESRKERQEKKERGESVDGGTARRNKMGHLEDLI